MQQDNSYSAEELAIIAKVRAEIASWGYRPILDYTDAEILEFYVPGQRFRLRAWEKEMLLARRAEAARAVLAGEPPDYAATDQRAREYTAKVFTMMRGGEDDAP